MKRLVTYVINADEDIAEKAYTESVEIIARSMPHLKADLRSIVVEPYDDARGIIASFEYNYVDLPDDKHRKASMSLQDSLAALIKMHLWYITNINVVSEPGALNAKSKK